ncbi:MAG: hypothetical protein WC238_01295 [Parcubacteria group bacterium]
MSKKEIKKQAVLDNRRPLKGLEHLEEATPGDSFHAMEDNGGPKEI